MGDKFQLLMEKCLEEAREESNSSEEYSLEGYLKGLETMLSCLEEEISLVRCEVKL